MVSAGTRRFDHVVSPVTLIGLGLFLYVVAIPVEIQLTGKPRLVLRSEIPVPDDVLTGTVPLAFVALVTFAAGYFTVVDRTPFRTPSFARPDVVRAQLALALCAGAALVLMATVFGSQLVATRDYTTSYTERYESPLYAVGMATTQALVAMLGFSLARFGRRRLAHTIAFAGALGAWGLYSNQKTPLVLAGSVALGFLVTKVRRPSGVLIGVTVFVMPVVLAVAAIAFSNFRGGAGFDLADRPGYLTTIEPAGPFVSIVDETLEPGSSAPDSGFGESILNGLVGWVPRAVWPDRPLDLAEQFARVRIPDWRPGEGYGYSPFAEAMHQGGIAGVSAYFFLLGLAVSVLRNLLLRRHHQGSAFMVVCECFYYVVFLLLLFTFFRGPLQAFVTTLVQYSAALVVALTATALLPRRRRESETSAPALVEVG